MMLELEIRKMCEALGDDATSDEKAVVVTCIVDCICDGTQCSKEYVREIVEREACNPPFSELWFRCYVNLSAILGE